MKTSTFTTGLIALAISAFSAYAQAEEVRRPNLSITPISEAQANAMRSHSVVKGSSIKTTVTIGNKGAISQSQVARVRVVNKARLKKQGNKAKVVIQSIVTEYQVQKGDTLSVIAKQHKTTIEHIMSINKLKTTKILIGQTLKI